MREYGQCGEKVSPGSACVSRTGGAEAGPVAVVDKIRVCLRGQLVTQRTLHQTTFARYIPFPLLPLAQPTWLQIPHLFPF